MAIVSQGVLEVAAKPRPRWYFARAFIACVSFATLCFLNAWGDLYTRQHQFFPEYEVSWQELAAVTLDVVLLAVVLWLPIYIVARSGNPTWIRILKWCVLLGLMMPLNIIRTADEVIAFRARPIMQAVPVKIVIVVLGISALGALLWQWERLSTKLISTIFWILSPALPLLIASVAWNILVSAPTGRLPGKSPAAALPQKAGAPHVLWFIFDEWDEALTFEDRPDKVKLPELDRLRNQSFHADRAYAPTRHTIVSISSLLAGKTFLEANATRAGELVVTYDLDKPPSPLLSDPTVFSEARSLGFNLGIVGFFLPYCRMFDTTFCEWYSSIGITPEEWGYPVSVGRYMLLAARRQASKIPFAGRTGLTRRLAEDILKPSLHAVTYHQTHKAVLQSIVDPRLNLVFIHWNIPHPPAIYDAAQGDFSNDPARSYLDNLSLLNRTVGEVRLTLEKAGLWDSSTILMSSDHPLRFNWEWPLFPGEENEYKQTSKVPFLLKLARQKQGFAYDRAIQTIVSKDLLLAIMKGEISQAEQVAAWLDLNPPRQ